MKRRLILFLLLIISGSTFSQCDGRYDNEIFSNIIKTTINYSDVYNGTYHEMDIYIPDGDTETNRPVILFMHGGSFYGGDKDLPDCQDFCESFAKRGYVTASVNYRLVGFLDIVNFLTYNSEQYETVLKATSDIKSAIRFFRKTYSNGNQYGIDPNAIFVGGSSAGAIIALHLAYIDNISDLPTSPVDVQSIVNNLGGLEGDAGNYGYSSEVNGVVSFAGGINNITWIDALDEPLVSIQGDADVTVNYNCGPGLNQATVLTLCGSGEMHPQAELAGIYNDHLLFPGAAHSWFASGHANPKFTEAVNFTSSFLYPILPCNNTTSISNTINNRKLVRITDYLGREIDRRSNSVLFYIYNNGDIERKMFLD